MESIGIKSDFAVVVYAACARRQLDLLGALSHLFFYRRGPLPHEVWRIYHLTPARRKQLNAARPAWRRAQAELSEAMGATEWDAMWSAFRTVTEVASRSAAAQRAARRTR